MIMAFVTFWRNVMNTLVVWRDALHLHRVDRMSCYAFS